MDDGGLGGYSQFNFLDKRTVQALDQLIGRSIAASPDGHMQVWLYVGVERGQIRQVGVSPVVGESIRFPDGGRRL